MENASKALFIAAGVLIALIILSLLVLAYDQISQTAKAEEAKKQAEQVADFNAQYEVYNKKLLYGVDILSLINKVNDNNIKYANEIDYQITVHLVGVTEAEIRGDPANGISGMKTNIFKCTQITYNTTTGRVSSMTFEEAD